VRSTTFLFTTWCTLVAKFRENLTQTLLDQHEQADRARASAPLAHARAPPPRHPGQPAPSRGRLFLRLGALRGALKFPLPRAASSLVGLLPAPCACAYQVKAVLRSILVGPLVTRLAVRHLFKAAKPPHARAHAGQLHVLH
jgi:hypothetical protein